LPLGSDRKLEGVVTDRNILYRLGARRLDPETVLRREILSRPVIACRETGTLRSATGAMAANHIRRLAVENEAGEVVGWLTLRGLSRKLLAESAVLQDGLGRMPGEVAA
jgi:CBS domain-containing protein